MAKQTDKLAGAAKAENAGSALSGLFAEENEFDRRALWRIGSWGAAAVGAVTVAVMSNHLSLGLKHDQVAAADLARQAQQIQALTKESQNETRRLASAIETLNGDRDRLFSRVTVIEQGLDSVTGALAKQAAPTPQTAATAQPSPGTPQTPQQTVAAEQSAPPAPVPGPVASTAARADGRPDATAPAVAANTPAANAAPATTAATSASQGAAAASLVAKSMMGPPDPAAPRLIESAKPADAKVADTRAADTKAAEATKSVDTKPADMTQAEAKVEAKVDPGRTDPKGADAGPAAASEVVASANAMAEPDAAAANVAVNRTEFAVDLGGANSLAGLRAIWRSVRHLNGELGALSPIVVIREGHTGLGMQLHLAAGPLKDAAAAAKICAVLAETKRTCETTVYDGQRLAMRTDEAQSLPAIRAAGDSKPEAKPDAKSDMAEGKADSKPEPNRPEPKSSRHSWSRHAKKEEPSPPPPPPPAPPKPESTSTFSSLFGRK